MGARFSSSAVVVCAVGALTVCLGCQQEAPANENDVLPEVLLPTTLQDTEEVQRYVENFPSASYRPAIVPSFARFYVDERTDVIKSGLGQGQAWEPHLTPLLVHYARPGTTAIDVGAHIGTHTLTLSRAVGSEGRVYAFEPQKKLYRELIHNMRLNGAAGVVPLRFAVGAEARVIEMREAVEGNEGGTPVGKGGDKAELRTLDSFGFANVSLIKIDVEGFEDYVLQGAAKTIRKWRPAIAIEIQGGKDPATASPKVRAKIEATKARLHELGYSVRHLGFHDYLATHAGLLDQPQSQPPSPGQPPAQAAPTAEGPTAPAPPTPAAPSP